MANDSRSIVAYGLEAFAMLTDAPVSSQVPQSFFVLLKSR
jgi:hypothetical protein